MIWGTFVVRRAAEHLELLGFSGLHLLDLPTGSVGKARRALAEHDPPLGLGVGQRELVPGQVVALASRSSASLLLQVGTHLSIAERSTGKPSYSMSMSTGYSDISKS